MTLVGLVPKPRVVLLHGVGLDHRMWRPLETLLSPRFSVRSLDLLGHGARRPAPSGITLEDFATDVAKILEPDTHLVGFSLGGLVAQHLARFRPDLVASLTSVSSVCDRTEAERASVRSRLDLAASSWSASVEASLDRWLPDAGSADDRAHTRAVLLGNDQSSYLNCYRVFATGDAAIYPELGRIGVPSLAITGSLDPGSTPDMTRRLAGAIPGGTAVIVEGARHLLPVERPGDLGAAFVSFMKENFDVT